MKERQNAPFKFLDPYSKEDKSIFFGRDQETEDLYNALSGVKHLLVYGPSGAGKTSLIECGLRNQFLDTDWFALTIRRQQNIVQSVFEQINKELEAPIPIDPATHLPIDGEHSFESIIETLFIERLQPIYLLFDQFEELLILGEEEEKKDFFKRLHQLIEYKVPCRILLIMREEFVGILSEFESLCPSIFQHRFRLEKMRRDRVEEVVYALLEAPEYKNDFEVKDSQQLAHKILSKLPDNRKEIELTYVQVFLSELWDRAKDKMTNVQLLPLLEQSLVTEEDHLENVLDGFLKKQIKELDEGYGDSCTLEVLASMISNEHTKLRLDLTSIQKKLKEKEVSLKKSLAQLIKDLESRRLVRALKSDSAIQYEISHDLLAKVIGQNLTEAMKLRQRAGEVYKVYLDRQGVLNQEDLDYIRPFEVYKRYPEELKQKIDEGEKVLTRERRRAWLLAFIGFALAVIATWQSWETNQARLEIERQKVMVDSTLSMVRIEKREKQEIIEKFYFHEGKFALAHGKNNRYKFINKKGYEVIDDSFYKAEPFDDTGYAQVQIKKAVKVVPKESISAAGFDLDKRIDTLSMREEIIDYLLDTTGKIYRVAYKLEDLTEDIRALDLRGEKQETFPKIVFNFPQLEVILLDGTYKKKRYFKTLPSDIKKLNYLKTLSLKFCNLVKLPNEVASLKNLNQLDLGSNELVKLPDEIGQLENLVKLSLEGNELKMLPSSINHLKNLVKLNLKLNQLKSLPKEVSNLKKLTVLYLTNNQLINLPNQIGQLQNLKELHLANNKLNNLPDEVCQLKDIQIINLYGNQLKYLPKQVGQLQNLKEWNLNNNDLTYLPEQIGQLQNLTKLHLENNELTHLPEQIGQLQNLTKLHLENNDLTHLPEQIGQLQNLTKLHLENNELTYLPEQIGQLRNLNKLYLRDNNNLDFKSVCQSFRNHPNPIFLLNSEKGFENGLTILIPNQLNDLPENIETMNSLTHLSLRSDKGLRRLQANIDNLPNLKVLDFSLNKSLDLDHLLMKFKSYPRPIKLSTYLGQVKNNKSNHLYIQLPSVDTFQSRFSPPPSIYQIKNLVELDLRDSNISPTELQTLKQKLPNCKIIHD